jgi:hypothetical protein
MARRPVEEPRHTGVTPTVETIEVDAVRLVTLDDPSGNVTRAAKGAFARLRPPPGLSAEEIESWRILVAKVARAVKVLPSQHAAAVPAASHRSEHAVGTIREEAIKLAKESANPDVLPLVKKILDEVER